MNLCIWVRDFSKGILRVFDSHCAMCTLNKARHPLVCHGMCACSLLPSNLLQWLELCKDKQPCVASEFAIRHLFTHCMHTSALYSTKHHHHVHCCALTNHQHLLQPISNDSCSAVRRPCGPRQTHARSQSPQRRKRLSSLSKSARSNCPANSLKHSRSAWS